MAPGLQVDGCAAAPTRGLLESLIAAALGAIALVDDGLPARAVSTSRDLPRSWHEAWLETDRTMHFSDVPDLTTGRWPTACDNRHTWTLVTVQGTREVTTVCTRRAHHTGRHAAGAFGRTIAVWEYPR